VIALEPRAGTRNLHTLLVTIAFGFNGAGYGALLAFCRNGLTIEAAAILRSWLRVSKRQFARCRNRSHSRQHQTVAGRPIQNSAITAAVASQIRDQMLALMPAKTLLVKEIVHTAIDYEFATPYFWRAVDDYTLYARPLS
jgi:hypothetical protein